ncbi:MAG: hypothetical protein SXA11_14735 [Cyanobacteriota bacterium]|nr:hypothetical protein [Cyanobacteriota bacterium]
MNKSKKFELLLEEPWICEVLYPPEDPLGELSELENNLRLFCYECNHKVALKIAEEKKELFLDPDIILALNYLPEQMRELSLGKKIEIDFPESWLILKFMPDGHRINFILHKFGNSCTIKEFQLDKNQVLEMFESFLEKLMQMAIAKGYISYEDKEQFLRGMAYV